MIKLEVSLIDSGSGRPGQLFRLINLGKKYQFTIVSFSSPAASSQSTASVGFISFYFIMLLLLFLTALKPNGSVLKVNV